MSGLPSTVTECFGENSESVIRETIRHICREKGVTIISGILSNQIHIFVEIPPKISVSQFMKKAKGCPSYRIQMKFSDIRKRYWDYHF